MGLRSLAQAEDLDLLARLDVRHMPGSLKRASREVRVGSISTKPKVSTTSLPSLRNSVKADVCDWQGGQERLFKEVESELACRALSPFREWANPLARSRPPRNADEACRQGAR